MRLIGSFFFGLLILWNIRLLMATVDYGLSREKTIRICLWAFPIGWVFLVFEYMGKLVDKFIEKI